MGKRKEKKKQPNFKRQIKEALAENRNETPSASKLVQDPQTKTMIRERQADNPAPDSVLTATAEDICI